MVGGGGGGEEDRICNHLLWYYSNVCRAKFLTQFWRNGRIECERCQMGANSRKNANLQRNVLTYTTTHKEQLDPSAFDFNSLSIFFFTSFVFYHFLSIFLHLTKTLCWKSLCSIILWVSLYRWVHFSRAVLFCQPHQQLFTQSLQTYNLNIIVKFAHKHKKQKWLLAFQNKIQTQKGFKKEEAILSIN